MYMLPHPDHIKGKKRPTVFQALTDRKKSLTRNHMGVSIEIS